MYSPRDESRGIGGGCVPLAGWLACLVVGGLSGQQRSGAVGECQQQQPEWQQSALKHNEITLDILSIKYG